MVKEFNNFLRFNSFVQNEDYYFDWRREVVEQEYNGLYHLFDKKVKRYNSW